MPQIIDRARATAGTSIASWRVVYGLINIGAKFWLGKTLTAAVTVAGSAALISDVKEKTSSKPILPVCASNLVIANYATICNAVHRVAPNVQ